jgi:lipopolysaccharide/colanic/teichoic acid biosynthesis glycosyltransferase
MSLVGPRPPIPYEVEEYKPWYTDRFDVLPGLTGLWQVSGKNRLSFNEMIRLDIQYVRKRSLLLDLKIMLLTPYALWNQVTDYLAKKKQRAQIPSPLQPS